MIQRITCALSLCLLLFIPFHDIMAGELVTRDSLNNTTDTLKNGFFHRLYRYFEQSNKVKEEKKFDFSIIGALIAVFGLTIPWGSAWSHPDYSVLTVKIKPSPRQTFPFTGMSRPRVFTC